MSKSTTTARVILTIDIDVSSTWSGSCTMKQIEEQAIAGAQGYVRNLIDGGRAKVVGQPKVTTITTVQP